MRTAKFIMLFYFSFFLTVLQGQTNIQQSPKPRISINGTICNIQYEEFTCSTKVCDPVIIYEGDSIEFSTVNPYSTLNNSAYKIVWNFPGSSLPQVSDIGPDPNAACHNPTWANAGNYSADIYYTGQLAICCCDSVPSHWQVDIIVYPMISSVTSTSDSEDLFELSFDHHTLSVNSGNDDLYNLKIYSQLGTLVHSSKFKMETKANFIRFSPGIYFIIIENEKGTIKYSEKLIR